MIRKVQIDIIFAGFLKFSTKAENAVRLLREEERAGCKLMNKLVWGILFFEWVPIYSV